MTPRKQTIDLIRRLVAFDTVSRNSNLALIDFVRGYLDDLGIDDLDGLLIYRLLAAPPVIRCQAASRSAPVSWVAVTLTFRPSTSISAWSGCAARLWYQAGFAALPPADRARGGPVVITLVARTPIRPGDKARVTEAGLSQAPHDVATQLGVDPLAQVIRRRQVTVRDGQTAAILTSWLPGALAEDAPELLGKSRLTEEIAGYQPAWGEDWVAARPPSSASPRSARTSATRPSACSPTTARSRAPPSKCARARRSDWPESPWATLRASAFRRSATPIAPSKLT